MKPVEPTPFEPEIEALLAAERGADAPPADVQARVWGRVQASIAAAPVASPSSPAIAASPAPLAAPAATALPWLKLTLVATAVVGSSALAWWQVQDRELATQPETVSTQVVATPPAAPMAPIEPVQTSPTPAAAAEPAVQAPAVQDPTAQEAATQEGALALPPARPPVPVHRRRRAPHRPKVEAAPAETAHGSLGAELKLLRAARAALNRGEAGAAFAGVQEHASQHPRGHLTEEREALAVQSLSALGRKEAAWARARRFEDRYPRSMMLPAVRAAVGQATP